MRLELTSPTPDDTRAIGAALSGLLTAGDAAALTGELGAGKTTLVQGVAAALGFTGHVVSPTFTLVREYQGSALRIFHVDVYRLERVQDVLDLGLDEMAEEGVLLVEWGDAIEALLPGDHLLVELLTVSSKGEERRIRITPVGASWMTRWERLEQAVERWRAAA